MKGGNQGSMPQALRDEVERGAPETRRKLEQVWHLLGRLEDDALNVPGTEEAWADLQTRLETPAPAPHQKARASERVPVRRSARRNRVVFPMIAGLAVLLLGVWLWRQPAEVVVPPGAQRIVTLPDGSTAHLNSDSRLRYHRGFQTWPFVPAPHRVVTLEGEVFFKVLPGTRPFVVETFNAQVEVLGTQFDVRARQAPWEEGTRVVLASGRVRVAARQDPDHPVVLAEAGQIARIGQQTAPPDSSQVQPVVMERLLVWRQNGFSVVDKPLAFILAEVERRFAVSIDVEEGVALTDSMSLFYPRGADAEQIIHDICLAQGCRYREMSSGFAVFPADL